MNEKERVDRNLDETLEETFPASDAPANTVETGIGVLVVERPGYVVTDNQAKSRFELVRDGEVAFLQYQRKADALSLVHTEVPPALRHQHIGDALVEAGVEAARSAGLRLVVICPFAKAYLQRHPRSV